jgi:hypothetical protein
MGLAITNNNPGNLRDVKTGGFRKFNSPDEGYTALMNDLQAKVTGASSTGLHGGSSLYEFAQKYAPRTDKNNPENYTIQLANQMGIRPDTKLSDLQSRIPEFAYAIANNEDGEFAKAHPISFPKYTPKQETPNTPDLKSVLSGQSTPQELPSSLTSGVDSVANPIIGAVTDPIAELYGGARNLATGESNPVVNNVFSGENVNALGYDKEGNKLSTGGTILQGAADVGETALNLASFGEGGAVLQGAKMGVNAIKPTLGALLKQGAKYGAGYGLTGGIRDINANDTAGEDALKVAGNVALGTGVGLAGAGAIHGLSKGVNKFIGQGPLQDVYSQISNLEREGKFAEADAIRNSPQTQLRAKLAGVDTANVGKTTEKEVKDVKQFLNDGIGRSSENAAMKKTLKAGKYSDSDYSNFIQEIVPPGKGDESFYAPTLANLQHNMSSLYEEASAPLLDKLQKTGIKLGDVNTNNLVNLVEKSLDKQGLIASDIKGLTESFRNIVEAEIQKATSEGRQFDITDMYKLVRNANTAFEKISPRGELGRASGDVLRKLLDNAANTSKNSEARAIIAHLRQVDNRYSELKRVEDLTKLFASLPGQKPSELMNKLGGMMGFTSGGPVGYAVGASLTKATQNHILAKRFGAMTGAIGNKAKQNSTDRLIGMSKEVMSKIDKLATERNTQRATQKASVVAKENLARQTTENQIKKEQAVSKLMETLHPTSKDIQMGPKAKSKFNKDEGLPNIAYGAAPFGAVGLMDKLKGMVTGKETYQRDHSEDNKTPEQVTTLKEQIATAETRGEKLPYTTEKWSNRNLGPASPYGKDLGRYQVTSARLREKSEQFLGKKVTDEEFLKSPELQDKFIEAQIKWQLSNGLTPDEVLATHRRGWGNMTRKQLDTAIASTTDYRNSAKGLTK